MIKKKYFEEWYGKKYPVRVVSLKGIIKGFSTIKVADYDLFAAIEYAYDHEDAERHLDANVLDNDIYYYCDSGFIASDPSDEEIIKYLRRNGALN